MTVLDNLRFAHRRRARREAIGIDEAIGALDLRALLHRRPASLSGGERQRVAIARALLRGPALVMMDEPLSSLDVGRKAEIIPYIERLPESFGLPVLYVTHNVEELARLATKMVLLARGRVVARGRVADLLERVDLWPVTGISEAGTVLEARVQSHADRMTALSIDGQRLLIPFIDVRPGSSVHLRVQARDVAIATAPPSGLSIRNVLAAELLSVDYSEGAYAELLLGIGSQHLRSRVTRQAVAELRLAEGQNVFALIKSVAFNGRLLG
jgi:molybdate transport system ATP-binding protein